MGWKIKSELDGLKFFTCDNELLVRGNTATPSILFSASFESDSFTLNEFEMYECQLKINSKQKVIELLPSLHSFENSATFFDEMFDSEVPFPAEDLPF